MPSYGPDETASNRLDAVFEVTDKRSNAEPLPMDDDRLPAMDSRQGGMMRAAVIAVDVTDEKLELASELGADHVVDARNGAARTAAGELVRQKFRDQTVAFVTSPLYSDHTVNVCCGIHRM